MKPVYPELIRNLPAFAGAFEAYQLDAANCTVLLANYPAGTVIDTHSHDTDNVGIITHGMLMLTIDGVTQRIGAGAWYHVPAHTPHAAAFEEDTAEIEFWFVTQD